MKYGHQPRAAPKSFRSSREYTPWATSVIVQEEADQDNMQAVQERRRNPPTSIGSIPVVVLIEITQLKSSSARTAAAAVGLGAEPGLHRAPAQRLLTHPGCSHIATQTVHCVSVTFLQYRWMDAHIPARTQAQCEHLSSLWSNHLRPVIDYTLYFFHALGHLRYGARAVDQLSRLWVLKLIRSNKRYKADCLSRSSGHLQQHVPFVVDCSLQIEHVLILLLVEIVIRKENIEPLQIKSHLCKTMLRSNGQDSGQR